MTIEPARNPAGPVCFADIQRFLALFAQGLAGRFLHVKVVESRNKGAALSLSANDESIHLPAAIADYAARAHNLGAYRIAVLHQIGFFTEGTRDFDLAGFLLNDGRPALRRRVFGIIEDMRIDAAIRRRYPGACGDLDRVLASALSKRPRTSAMRPVPALIEALLQYSLGAPPATLHFDAASGLLAGLIDTAAVANQEGAQVVDSARAALIICTELEKLFRLPPRRRHASAADEFTGPTVAHEQPGEEEFGEIESAGLLVEFRGELKPDSWSKRRAGAQVATAGQDAPSPAKTSAAAVGSENTPEESPHAPAAILPSRISAGPRSFLYDEWNFHRHSYLASWCRVYEHRLRGDDFGFIGGVRSRHSALEKEVRRRFGAIKPQSWRRVRRTSDGDELDLDGMVETVVDRRTGQDADSRLYIRRDRARRDVAAAFLVDMSASTDFPLPDASAPKAAPADTATAQPPDSGLYLYGGQQEEPPMARAAPKRRVIDVAKDALALMCDALETLGDSHAIYGFSGDGRHNVEFYIAKDFADRLTGRTWAALGAMQPRRSTRMGAAIRHAITKLRRESAGMKVLIIVSDGYPEDHDYGADRTDREYGIQDTARALREAEHAGVTDFCVTIDPAGHDYLRRMCRESRYLVIDDVTALPRELSKIYRTLTQV